MSLEQEEKDFPFCTVFHMDKSIGSQVTDYVHLSRAHGSLVVCTGGLYIPMAAKSL